MMVHQEAYNNIIGILFQHSNRNRLDG